LVFSLALIDHGEARYRTILKQSVSVVSRISVPVVMQFNKLNEYRTELDGNK